MLTKDVNSMPQTHSFFSAFILSLSAVKKWLWWQV